MIGFSHDCERYEAHIKLYINTATFAYQADSVLFTSGFEETVKCEPCQECSDPDTYACAVTVHGASDTSSSSFAMILNDAYDGNFEHSTEWVETN